jgi:predicted O-methyltransferase YrrM
VQIHSKLNVRPRLHFLLRELAGRLRGPSAAPSARSPQDLDLIGEPFASVLRSMYSQQPQWGADGQRHELDSTTRISIEEGLFLYQLCRDSNARETLEIGCAYGFSTIYFLAALSSSADAHHFAIDPCEYSYWKGIGAKKADELGMGRAFRLLEEMSTVAIPRLRNESLRFDVIFIDGEHRFDDVLVDFTLSAVLCKQGGFIIFDDMWLPPIRKVVSFVRRNRADFTELPVCVSNISVFRRTSEDRRAWNHFEDFD